ncbi:MAG: hypothetical protein Q8P92_02780 [Candidatus Daviesbacteria bacterium]|nr:hypothetical protein [Candidatus Daviesbacteria bacterium]
MIEILPIKLLTDEDSPIFGSLNTSLAKLSRVEFPVANGIVITPPTLKLKTALELHDFGTKEVYKESWTLMEKGISNIPIPENLVRETQERKLFYIGEEIKSVKILWLKLLQTWLTEIKNRLWNSGFDPKITQDLEPQIVIFIKRLEASGTAFFDPISDDSVITVKKGKPHPNDMRKLDELVRLANRKLFIPHEYEWIVDNGVKLTRVFPYTPFTVIANEMKQSRMEYNPTQIASSPAPESVQGLRNDRTGVVKVFLDLSQGLVVEKEVDGVYISSEKIFDLNKPRESLEDLILRVVDAANTFPHSPILFKLADKSEGMGQIRGTLRLLHQDNLREPILDALDFIRYKKVLSNVHIVIPFIRGIHEFLQIKKELSSKKLVRKNSLQIWMEAAIPENILNLENYLEVGLDGVVLNLDELVSHLNGFDLNHEELITYKNDVEGLMKFLEDGIRLLLKAKIPFIAYGSLTHNPHVLEYLVEKGVYGIVVERYEAHSAKDLLHQTERRIILRKNL